MKRKNGFTLIELLAVIVILAIIALIATPIVLNMINSARKKAAESSAYGFIDAIEYNNGFAEMEQPGYVEINGENLDVTSETFNNLKIKGKKPSGGYVTIVNGKVTGATDLCFNNYSVDYDGKKATVELGCNSSSSNDENPSTPEPVSSTYTAYSIGNSINYNPVTNQLCDNPVSTTETKTGCMKWYVIKASGESDSTVDVILDHNTTARIKWNDSNSNAYESSNVKVAVDDLVTTSNWKVTPRIITANEINTITGRTVFDSSDASHWYYFDSLTQDRVSYSESVRSDYAWLYNNLYKCKTDSPDYGCTIEDNNTYTGYGTAENGETWAYWTSTTLGTSSLWLVGRDGNLGRNQASTANIGIRPVVTISKTPISN